MNNRVNSVTKAYFLAAVLLMAVLFMICGCGQSGGGGASGNATALTVAAAFTLDVERAGERLYEELTYRDALEELPAAVVYVLLGIDEGHVSAQKNYFSSGATAEEVIVFQAKDEAALKALRQAVEARIEDQKDVYVSYAPKEVDYLKGAVVEEKGAYLIYCVAEDSAAAAKLIREVLENK